MYKLMIVDDSNIIRNRIERGFNELQFDLVATAGDGKTAVEHFKKFKPDIITMDITMPEMDGLECIQEIMAIDNTVSILVISALTDEYTGLQALAYGARGFLYKPFSDEELMNALNDLVTNP
ncbi:MAG: response regulator [Neisseria sp.]|nr:response regulator [Neisseria sp.]